MELLLSSGFYLKTTCMLKIEQTEIGHKSVLLHVNSLQLNPGSLYVLIGRNGVGKSTFLNTLIGRIPALVGDILLQEKSIFSYSKKELSKKVSLVRATFTGIENLSVNEYLTLGRIPYTNVFGTTHEQDILIVNEVIHLLGLQHLSEKFTTQLSDGEKQLVAIAQALVQQTQLVLLDEPTAFLDYENKWNILKTIKRCTQDNQLCTIFSSHDLEMALEIADYLLLINPFTKEIKQVKATEITKQELLAYCFPSL